MRWLPLAAASLISSLLAFGCGRQDVAVTVARRAPVLKDAAVAPQSFDFAGGTANVSVAIESERGVRLVMAQAIQVGSEASPRYFSLALTAGGAYQAAIPIPSNISAGGQAVRYRIVLFAEDLEGVRSDPMEFQVEVAAPDSSTPLPP